MTATGIYSQMVQVGREKYNCIVGLKLENLAVGGALSRRRAVARHLAIARETAVARHETIPPCRWRWSVDRPCVRAR